MLEDVLDALLPAMGAERCLIVTVDEDAIAAAVGRGVRDDGDGRARRPYRRGDGGGAHAGRRGRARIHDDAGRHSPRHRRTKCGQLLAAHRPGRAFTIAPSHDELGSNGIVCTPWNAVPLRFGDNSFYPHLDAARRVRPRADDRAAARGCPGHRHAGRYRRGSWVPSRGGTPERCGCWNVAAGRIRSRRRKDGMNTTLELLLSRALEGMRPSRRRGDDARRLRGYRAADGRCRDAARPTGTASIVSYSRKVFIPLTQLCRDVCHYCTFAHAAAEGRARLPDRRRGAGDRARRAARRLPRGAVHARRQAGAAVSRRARGARARSGYATTLDYLAAMARAGAQGDGPAAARQSRRDDGARHRRAARGLGVAGHHAGDGVASGWRERGGPHFGSPDKVPALRLADDRGRRRARGAVHHRHPDRHRRDARGTDRGAAGAARPARAATGISRKSSSRTSGPSPARAWRTRRSRSLDEHAVDRSRSRA